MLIPRLAPVPGFLIVFNVYTVLFVALYAYEKLVASADEKKQAKVVANTALADNVRSLTVQLPAKEKVRPGDLYFVAVKQQGFSQEVHPFSVSQVQGNGQVTLLLHEKGDYTRKIGQIKKGSVL